MSINEPTVSRRRTAVGSNRSFGIVFAVIFGIVALSPILAGRPPRLWASIVACAFVVVVLVAPQVLWPLNRAWFYVGLALHRLVTPLIMGIIYVSTVVPVGLILKACGKDLLRLKREPDSKSYWIDRDPPGPAPGSMTKQF
jgi:hypothetical protein